MSMVPLTPGMGGMSIMSNMGNSGCSMVMMSQSFSNINGSEVSTSVTSTRIGPDGVAEVKSQAYTANLFCFFCMKLVLTSQFSMFLIGTIMTTGQIRDGRTGEERILLERRLGEQVGREISQRARRQSDSHSSPIVCRAGGSRGRETSELARRRRWTTPLESRSVDPRAPPSSFPQ